MANENEWVITDPSCNQMYRKIDGNYSHLEFKEDRVVNPDTGETEEFRMTLDYTDYDWWELVDACQPFGYSSEQVDKWITEGEEIPLMLECLFEMSN